MPTHVVELRRFDSDNEPADGEPPQPPPTSHERRRILVVLSTARPDARKIAGVLTSRLRDHGYVVELGDARHRLPPPADYDGVVVGVPAMFGRDIRPTVDYVETHRDGLATVRTALFIVTMPGTLRGVDPCEFLDRLVRSTGWQPDLAAAFGGDEPSVTEGVIVRLAKLFGYSPARDRRDVTDATDVGGFANAVATDIAASRIESPSR